MKIKLAFGVVTLATLAAVACQPKQDAPVDPCVRAARLEPGLVREARADGSSGEALEAFCQSVIDEHLREG